MTSLERFRKEAIQLGITSPNRQQRYIRLRFGGSTKEDAFVRTLPKEKEIEPGEEPKS